MFIVNDRFDASEAKAFASFGAHLDFIGLVAGPNYDAENDDLVLGGIDEIEDGLPRHRLVVTASHLYRDLRLLSRFNVFSSFKDVDNTGDFEYGPQVYVDIEAGYRISPQLNLVLGAQNVFNTFTDLSPISTDVGNKYPENAPNGTNGGFYYARVEATM